MDERVLGDMPSEGSDGGRRFGIYRATSPDPKMYSISRMRVLFVAAIAAVVSFAVFFPMIQYVSRINKKNVYYPYSELANLSIFKQDGNVIPPAMNCSSNIFSFGHDCSDDNVQTNLNISDDGVRNDSDSTTIGPDYYSSTISETTTQPNLDTDDMNGVKSERIGRSRQQVVSTPYPYYNLPKPTPSLTDRRFEDFSLPETPIFAIPLDLERETFTEYKPLKPMVNFTPPPYAFTPLPNFTDRYAQLSPYKVPNNSSNFEDVMKFLKNSESSKENKTAENTQTGSNSRITTMKVKGTYTMPLDDVGVSGETVTFYNGHAYISDPFVKFRPSHPLDINRLMPAKPGLEVNPRFRRPYPILPGASRELDPSGSHTVAIFHPPSPSSPRPLSMSRPMTSSPKPLTVTLDIYPVTMDMDQDQVGGPSTTFPGRDRGRLNPKWRPRTTERPRWRPPGPRNPPTDSNRPPDNHMIVHLNLFPNKRKPYSFLRRSKSESSTESGQTTVIGGGQFQARNSLEKPSDHSSTEAMDRTTALPLTSSTGGEREFTISVGTPENSALPSNNEENNVEEYDDNMTTITDNLLPLDNEQLDDVNDTFAKKLGEGDEYDLVDTVESSGANSLENVSLEEEYDSSEYTEEQVEDTTEHQGPLDVEGNDYELTTDATVNEPLIQSSIPLSNV